MAHRIIPTFLSTIQPDHLGFRSESPGSVHSHVMALYFDPLLCGFALHGSDELTVSSRMVCN